MNKLFSHNDFNFNFIGKKKIWYIIALLAIVPGLIVMIFCGMNMGIDFTGGSIITVQYDSPVELEDVRQVVSNAVKQTPSVNESNDNIFHVKTEELTETESDALVAQLETLGTLTVTKTQRIGPIIGSELLANARWALLIAGILMLAYITIRFKFNKALTAILALAHDTLVLISVFTIFRIEVDSSFIAALLTIIGYSINNTIVIFDRIRENEAGHGKKDYSELVNRSINQTLTRTINTTIAVLLLLICLLIFGGDTTKNFVFGLSVGMVAGFFSSVFLVGNLLIDISKFLSPKLGGTKKMIAAAKK